MFRVAHSVLGAALAAVFISVLLAVPALAGAAESPASSSTVWSHEDAQRYITSYFPYIWDESYVAYGPMGVSSGALEVNRRYTRTVDPRTGQSQLTWSEGLFGYEVPGSGGRVAPIDTSLRRVTGGFSPRGVGYRLRLPARFGDGVVWGDEASGSPVVTLVPVRSRALRAGKIVGPKSDKVLYPDVWPVSDVVMTATGVGVKDHIIVRDLARAPEAYSFIVRRPAGAKTQVAADGSVAVALAGGESIALLEAPRAQDARGQGVDIWYTSSDRGSYDLLTMRYSVKPRLVGAAWITYAAPLDLDPALYTDEIDPGVDAWPDTSGHTGAIADTSGGLRVQLSKRAFAYPNEAFAQWRIGRPPAGASWYSLAGDINVRVGANQRYALSSGGVNKYVRVGGSDPEFSSNHFTFTAPNDESYFVSRIDMTAAASTPFDYFGTLSNVARTFVDEVDPSRPSIGSSFGDRAPSTFQASTSFSDGQSGCGGGSILVIDEESGAVVRSQGFDGCGATLTFVGVPAGTYTLRSQVRDRAGRTNANSTDLEVYPAPELWVASPLDGDFADSSLLVTGGVGDDDPFLSGYEISLDGRIVAMLPASESFTYLLATGDVSEGDHTLTVAARDVAGEATEWDVEIVIDHSAPQVQVTEPAEGQYVSGTVTIAAEASETVSEVASVQVLVDGGVIATCVDDPTCEADLDTLGLSAGTHTLTARATNSLGLARVSVPRTIVVDNLAPTATIISPANDGSIIDTASFVIAAGDNFAVADVQLDLYNARNVRIGVGSATAAGTYVFSLDTTRIQSGAYTLSLTVVDRAGNEAVVEQPVRVANPVYVLGSEQWLSATEHDSGLTVGHATGNLTTTSMDVSTRALGLDLQLGRSYNSQDERTSGIFGASGWRASFERSITIGLDGVATYTDGDGTRHVFQPADGGGFERAQGLTADLVQTGSGYELRYNDGLVERYTASGVLVEDIDRNGNRRSFERDASGRVYRIGDDSGLGLALAYDDGGRLVSVTDQINRVTRYGYDDDGRLSSSTDPTGARTSYAYGSSGRLVALTDPVGRRTLVMYGADGRVAAIQDNAGVRTVFAYDGAQVSTTVAGARYVFELDEAGRATRITDPQQDTIATTYDEQGLVSEQVNESGDSTTYTYDAAGRRTSETLPGGATTNWSDFDRFGNARSVEDAAGGVTRFTFDASGNQTSVTTPEGSVTRYAYDEVGNKTSETDPLGNRTSYGYDAHGALIETVRPGGLTSTRTVDAAGQLLASVDPTGASTRLVLDQVGRVLQTQDALGNLTLNSYNAAGDTISTQDANGNVTTFAYDTVGRQTIQRDALGGETQTRYDALGNEAATIDQNQNTTRYDYNARGDLTSETDPLGRTTTYTIDAQGRTIAQTDPAGFTTRTIYDANGNELQTVNPDGSVTAQTYTADDLTASTVDGDGAVSRTQYDADRRAITTIDPLGNEQRTQYDSNGNRVGEIDRLGRSTRSAFDALSRVVSTENPDGTRRGFTYDAAGRQTSTTDENGNTTATSFDALGRVTARTDATGAITRYAYDANGNLTSETDPLGQVTSYRYDALDRRVTMTDAEGNLTRYLYDAVGNQIATLDAQGQRTQNTFDKAGQLVATTDANGLTTTYGYDSRGNQTSVTMADGRTTTTAYDSMGRTTSVTDPQGATTSYAYDRAGRVIERTDPGATTTTYSYDAAGRITRETSSSSGTTTRSFDAEGNLLAETTSAGTTRYQYDARNRVTAISYPDGQRETFDYDGAGNLLTRTDAAGTTRYRYDAANRPTSEQQDGGVAFAYAYDAAGRVTRTSVDGQATTFQYDARSLLTRMSSDAGTSTYTYTPRGQLATATGPDARTTTYSYDAAKRLTRIATPGGSDISYAFDRADRITRQTIDGREHTYTYDARGQLTSWTLDGITTLYSYDTRGNRTSESRQVTNLQQTNIPPGIKTQIETCLATSLTDCSNPQIKETIEQLQATYPAIDPATLNGVRRTVADYFASYAVPTRTFQYNANNQLVTLRDERTGTQQTFDYDERGNQTRAGDRTLQYDSRNRLTRITWPGNDISYTYDQRGLITERTENGQTSRYWYDTSQRIRLELRPDGTRIRYRHGANGLEGFTIGDATYRLNTNHRGDVTTITSASGDTIARYAYTPSGETSATGDPDVLALNTHTYNGRDQVRLDPTTGMYWMRARWYAPEQGRFVSVDPLPAQDGTADNAYSYASNDPVNNVDPSGKYAWRTKRAKFKVYWEERAHLDLTALWVYLRWQYNGKKVRNVTGSTDAIGYQWCVPGSDDCSQWHVDWDNYNEYGPVIIKTKSWGKAAYMSGGTKYWNDTFWACEEKTTLYSWGALYGDKNGVAHKSFTGNRDVENGNCAWLLQNDKPKATEIEYY